MKLSNSNARRVFATIAGAALMALWTLSPIDSMAAQISSELQSEDPPPYLMYQEETVGSPDDTGAAPLPAEPGPLSTEAAPPFTEAVPLSTQAAPLSIGQNGSLLSGTRAVGSLVFILAMIVIATVLLKRYMPHRFGPLGQKRRIHVLETVAIGEKRSITLVEIDGDTLLLASTPGSVSLVKEIRPNRGSATDAQTDLAGTEDEPAKTENPDSGQFKKTLAAEVARRVHAGPDALARISRFRAELEVR